MFRDCRLEKTDWAGVTGYRGQWLNRTPGGAPWPAGIGSGLVKPLFAPAPEPRTNEQLAWLAGSGSKFVAFAPNPVSEGRLWLASAGHDGTVRLWDVASGAAGHAVWDPESNRVIAVAGDAWRYLAWMRPLPNALPERLPLETFGPVPLVRETA